MDKIICSKCNKKTSSNNKFCEFCNFPVGKQKNELKNYIIISTFILLLLNAVFFSYIYKDDLANIISSSTPKTSSKKGNNTPLSANHYKAQKYFNVKNQREVLMSKWDTPNNFHVVIGKTTSSDLTLFADYICSELRGNFSLKGRDLTISIFNIDMVAGKKHWRKLTDSTCRKTRRRVTL